MRILNIFFKNINSLEGEGRVDFDQGPIADSGVFAITGPNGSGKTSILDVITLGLYGETFRFDKPAAHVMTKQTHECFAQVEFALGGEKFRSSWRVKTNAAEPEADVQLPEMTLQRINGQEEVLAETPSQVRNRIAELTGMDFHKFSKSMVLPQGDFAAFLNALDSERMDILEKISGTDIYAEYRQQAEDQYSQSETRLNQLQQDIASIPLLNEEALNAVALDLQDFQEQVVQLKQQQQQAQDHLNGLQNITALGQQQQQLDRRRQDLLVQVLRYQQDLQRIAGGQSAQQYRSDLALLDQKQAQLEQNQTTLENFRQELAILRQQLGAELAENLSAPDKTFAEQKQAIDTLKLTISELKLELPRQTELSQAIQQQITDNQTALTEIENWLHAHQSDAVLLDDFPDIARLRNLRSDLSELNGKQKAQANWSKNTSSALKKNKANLDSTQSDLVNLKAQIESDQKTIEDIAQGKNFDELKELLQEQQVRVGELKELNALAEVTARLTKKGWFSWFGNSNKQGELPEASELEVRLAGLRAEISREENIIKILEQAIRNEAMVKKMNADRARLVEGQPCYLCGSLTHPYVLKPPVATDAKKALVDQRGKIQALKSRIDSVTTQLKAAQKVNSQMTAKQTRLHQIRSQWTMLANRLVVMRDGMAIGNLSLQKQLLNEETEELNKLGNLVKEHAQLQRNIAKAKHDIENKQALLEKLTQTVGELENNWNNRPPEFTDAEQRYNACLTDEKSLVAKLEAQLSALGEKMPSKGKENPLFDRLNSRRQDYQIYLLRQKGLQDEINALNEKLQACQSTLIAYQERMASSLETLSEQERVGLHLALIEKQKLIVDQEHQLRVAEIEFEAIQRSLTEKLAGSEHGSLENLREVLILIEREAKIQQQYANDRAQLEDIEAKLRQLAARLEAESASIDHTLPEQDIQRDLRNFAERIDIAEQEIRSLQNKLDKQQQYRDRYLALKDQQEEQQRVFEHAASELELIKDERGGFRRKIQQLMIDKLLSQTNQILEKLSGRYYVRGAASDHGLALEIEDTKQKNLRRLPQTLSGGESFVVSLALALALAEIANNGKAIDSLFLDEGFGNLDAESLYLAMSTLEGLRTQGKIVGVISHVEGVKKRIKTQIELVKKANGLSELKMVA